MTRRPKPLSSEDRVLWGKVARTVEAYPGRLESLESTPDEPGDAPPASSVPRQPVARENGPSFPREQHRKADRPAREPGLNPIDRTTYRKLARGRLPIEASIDLHGLTQSQAFGLLHGFLGQAHAKGMRHVLVITGRGSLSGGDGVLRRALPQWLRTPEFRAMASGCEPAGRGHGGDGAYYVKLRKRQS